MALILVCVGVLPMVALATPPAPLPALNIDIAETSVSGISSGGFMAVQFQVAHSSIVKGAGIVAAGPYFCAQNSAITATTKCSCTLDPTHRFCGVLPTSTDVPSLVDTTARLARDKLIDDPKNIARHRVLSVSGGQDQTVPAPVVAQLLDYYAALGMPAANISATSLPDAGHGMPTVSYGKPCAVTAEPYLNKCNFDAAGKILGWIYGTLNPQRSGAKKGRFIEFDQRPYFPQHSGFLSSSGLDSSGWLYVPDPCATGGKCRIHIALHGCKMGQSYATLEPLPGDGIHYGKTFVEHAGYDAWADTNRLVMLFPQAVSSPALNPNGCWDWWGYSGTHYADKSGVQIAALRAMVDRLAGGTH